MMATPALAKLLLLAAGGVGAWALFSGDGGSPGGAQPRVPYTVVIRVPGTPALPWDSVDDALCLAFDVVGGADSRALLDALAARLYPGVPFPPIAGDHPSVGETYSRLGARVSAFINRVEAGQPVCVGAPPAEPEDDDPPATKVEVVQRFITNRPGGFGTIIPARGNPTEFVSNVYGIPANETGRLRRALACLATVGYNLLLYGRPQPGDDYGRGETDGRWYDVSRAWLPQHSDPRIVAAEGGKIGRQVSWSGGSIAGGPSSFGVLWIPPMLDVGNTLVCSPLGTWNPERNPPIEVLRALGWSSLAEMETSWKAGPNEGPNA
jgi:hypothetical protein